MKREGLICETVPARERALILGQEISDAIDAGTFVFSNVVGWYSEPEGKPVCGCALGAAAHALGGKPQGASIYSGLASIGFMTNEEIAALEDGYEDDPKSVETLGPKKEPGARAFYRLGQRLRARPDSKPVCGK